MRRSPPTRARKIAVWCGMIGLGLALNEAMARMVTSSFDEENYNLRGASNAPECVEPSLSRGYTPRPEKCGVDENGERLYHGPPAPKARVTRILQLGDSISTQTTWPSTLANELQARWPGTAVELHTLAVAGYNLCQELSLYEENVDRIKPDFVLLQTSGNDSRGSPVLVHQGNRVRYFVGDNVVEFPRWVTHSRFLTLLAVSFAQPHAASLMSEQEAYAETCLTSLQADIFARKSKLLVLLFPLLWEPADIPDGARQDEQAVLALHAKKGTTALDLRPFLAALGPMESHRDSPTDFIHPNPASEKLIGTEVARWITANLTNPASGSAP